MKTILFSIFLFLLLALMVGLRRAATGCPNADWLLSVMQATIAGEDNATDGNP